MVQVLKTTKPDVDIFDPLDPENQIEVLLLIEILLFYFNIIGQMIFLFMSRCFKFYTIRERLGLGGNMRYRKDFLEFVKDDVHYLLIWIMEFLIYNKIIQTQSVTQYGKNKFVKLCNFIF